MELKQIIEDLFTGGFFTFNRTSMELKLVECLSIVGVIGLLIGPVWN